MARRRPHRHERQRDASRAANTTNNTRRATASGRNTNDVPDPVSLSEGIDPVSAPRRGVGTMDDAVASAPGDVGIGGTDMFGENTASASTGDTGKMNREGGGTDAAGFGTTDQAASDPLGGATTGGSSHGITPGGTDVSRGESVEGDPG